MAYIIVSLARPEASHKKNVKVWLARLGVRSSQLFNILHETLESCIGGLGDEAIEMTYTSSVAMPPFPTTTILLESTNFF